MTESTQFREFIPRVPLNNADLLSGALVRKLKCQAGTIMHAYLAVN